MSVGFARGLFNYFQANISILFAQCFVYLRKHGWIMACRNLLLISKT